MRLLSIIYFSLLLLSCSTKQTNYNQPLNKEEETKVAKDTTQTKVIIGKPFFNFNNVTHYQSKAKKSVELLLIEDTVLSHKDSILALTHCEPQIKKLSDSTLIKKLIPSGFKKHPAKIEHIKSLKSIFSLKNKEGSWAALCTPIYRDYLIFRSNNKITGIAIICFTCQQYNIIGNNTPITNFGSDGDFNKLRQLLQENKK